MKKIISNYVITETLYESSSSLIYRAVQKQDNTSVILKILQPDNPTPEELSRFQYEYELTHNLNVEGVNKALSIEPYHNTLIIIEEDIVAQSMDKHIKESMLTLEECLSIAVKIAQNIGNIHAENVIHKNITPSNIIWNSKTSQLKIIDFGIASRLPSESLTLKNTGQLEGTIAYMSPEQTGRINRLVDYRTDFYSLGIVLYEVLTGRLPFISDDPLEIIHSHLAFSPAPPHTINKDIPATVSSIVMKLLSKNAEDRYQSALGLIHDLKNCIEGFTQSRSVKEFTPGGFDFTGRFQIPQKLYGRENEISMLLDTFEKASKGSAELLLVAGYSGVGKTALIREVHKPIVKERGFFIEGKVDQYQRNIPYIAWSNAFSQLVDNLLMGNEEQLDHWRTVILNVVGSNGKLLTDFIPNLEMIIGVQPELLPLGAQESQNRFNNIFQRFTKVISQKGHPLVVFLDDMQWIDLASLNLLHILMTDPELKNFMFIGAYRDNEVEPSHPLMSTLEELKNEEVKVSEISLQNLLEDDILALCAESLQCRKRDSKPLASLLFSKTAGNAFFIHQMLHDLYDQKLLTFNNECFQWQWNIEELEAMDITDNVATLMISKVKKLPSTTQAALKLASCIGNPFDVATLTIIANDTEENIQEYLLPALRGGVLFALGNGYKFSHDRIQQAAYSIIAENEKLYTHLNIGRLLLQNIPEEEQESRVFDIVNQINKGRSLIEYRHEKREFAELNLIAGKRSKVALAYNNALHFISEGISFLPSDCWESDYALTLALYTELHECQFLNAMFEVADETFDVLINKAEKPQDLSGAYYTKIYQDTMNQKYENCGKIGFNYLAELGIDMGDDFSYENAVRELRSTEKALNGRTYYDFIDAPDATDINAVIGGRILSSLVTISFFYNPLLIIFIGLKTINQTIKYGPCKGACFPFACMELVYIMLDNRYGKDVELGGTEFAIQYSEKFNDESERGVGLHSRALFVNHWSYPLIGTQSISKEAFRNLINVGSLTIAGFTYYSNFSSVFDSGQPLEKVRNITDEGMSFLLKTRNDHAWGSLVIYSQLMKLLQGETVNAYSFDTDTFRELDYLDKVEGNVMGLCYYHTYKAMTLYLFNAPEEALLHADKAEPIMRFITGFYPVAVQNFYHSLILCEIAKNTEVLAERDALLSKVDQKQLQMMEWAENAPMNFQHKYDLVEAEKRSILGDVSAIKWYEKAINGAIENQFTHEEALSYELAAKFYLVHEMTPIAQLYMNKAHGCYKQWGASAKLQELEEHYPELLQNTKKESVPDVTDSHNLLDLHTIIKASQAISSEIVLEQLLTKLMQIVIESAGAQKGLLLLEQDEKWTIEAEGNVDKKDVTIPEYISIDNSNIVCTEIVNYVARTRKILVLNDVLNQGDFTLNPYVQKHKIKSILCLPMIHKGELKSMLYLENHLAIDVFSEERVQLLEILISQAVIALEKARLFDEIQKYSEKLTEEVTERKKAEEALRESEAKFRTLVINNEEIIFMMDKDGIFQLSEGKGLSKLGMNPGQVVGESAVDIYKDYPDVSVNIKKALKGESLTVEQQVGDLYFSSCYSPHLNSSGEIIGLLGLSVNITDRKLAEKALRESEEKLNALFSSLTEIVVIHELVLNAAGEAIDYRIIDCNKVFAELIGISKEDAIGKLASDVYQTNPPPYLEKFAEVALGGDPHEFTTYYPPFDKHLMISVVSPQAGKFATITTDISDMMQIQEMIMAKNKEMENYLYIASHDLRAPLVNIQGFSQRFKKQADAIKTLLADKTLEPEILHQLGIITDEEIPKTLSFVLSNIEKMDTLINGLLQISRTGRVDMNIQKIDMNVLFAKILQSLDFQIKEAQCKIHMNLLPECYGDAALLDQLFANIISNALKYSDSERDLKITVDAKTIYNKVVYSIRDNGKGIAQKHLEKIFDVFYRIDPRSSKTGEGIGLSLVKRIVEKHKGKVWAESEEFKGSVFYIELHNLSFTEF